VEGVGSLLRFEEYLKHTDLRSLLELLSPRDVNRLLGQVEHFTLKEAEHRDEIVLDYFGDRGIDQIVSAAVREITSNHIPRDPAILDVGAGIGTFTIPIFSHVKEALHSAAFYAMDVTPAMLKILVKRNAEITPFMGLAENILGSITHARKYLNIPVKFDVVLSSLTLHHCPDVSRVFCSFQRVLSIGGKAIIIDLCEHPFTEFREEMGDYHLGFGLDEIQEIARLCFGEVRVQKLPGICCSSSGRSAELFISTVIR